MGAIYAMAPAGIAPNPVVSIWFFISPGTTHARRMPFIDQMDCFNLID